MVLEFDWLCVEIKKNLIEMTTDQPVLPSDDEEIDLREVFAALQRRWGWAFGCGLLGLALAAGFASRGSHSAPLIRASLIVDIAQGPCYSRTGQLKVYPQSSVVGTSCFGELDEVRQELIRLARSSFMFLDAKAKHANFSKYVDHGIDFLAFDERGKIKSQSHIVLSVKGPSNLAPKIFDKLTLIKKGITLHMANISMANGHKFFFGPDWIRFEKPTEMVVRSPFPRSLFLGLLGGAGRGRWQCVGR